MSFASIIGDAATAVSRAIAAPLDARRRAKALATVSERVAPIWTAKTPRGNLRFRCPTTESVRVPAKLMEWEPETIKWIDENIKPDECLWDIGAHIGAFSLYAALGMKPGKGQVIAFEPSAQNYAALNDNIALSGLGDRVSAYCVALSDQVGTALFHMASQNAGGTGHAFGAPENNAGAFVPGFSQAMIGFSIDEVIRLLGLRSPDHIKLDVDSIEDKILRGAERTLPGVKSLLIEVEHWRSEAWVKTIVDALACAGLEERTLGNGGAARNRFFVNQALMAGSIQTIRKENRGD